MLSDVDTPFGEIDMPCMCYYEPSDEKKKEFERLCQELVTFIKNENRGGDPLGIDIPHAKELIEHLYDPHKCKEKER